MNTSLLRAGRAWKRSISRKRHYCTFESLGRVHNLCIYDLLYFSAAINKHFEKLHTVFTKLNFCILFKQANLKITSFIN